MKLLGLEISRSKGKAKETFKGGYVASGQSPKPHRINVGELSWEGRCRYYSNIDQRHPLAKACIRTIAGQVMAQGLFLTPVTDDAGKPYPRTSDAKDACDELNAKIGLDTMLYESSVTLAKFGSVFWEKDLDSFNVRIVPSQELIDPAVTDGKGNVTQWRQKTWESTPTLWDAEEIVHVPWDITSATWPYGTSLLVGLETEFEILEQLEIDIKEFMHRTAFPREMYQIGDGQFVPSGDDMEVIKSRIEDWEPGEYIVTSYPIEHKSGGTGDSEVRNLNDVLTFLKCQLVDGLMTPPVSFQYSSTYASSKEMMVQQRANLVVPMQRLFKRKIETEVYKPFLESRGFSVKDTPTLHFESAEAHRVDMADYYLKLTSANIMPPRFAAQELGIPEEMYDAWQLEKQKQQEKIFTQKTEQPQQQAQTQQTKPFQKREGAPT
jgi:hypothetical protein